MGIRAMGASLWIVGVLSADGLVRAQSGERAVQVPQLVSPGGRAEEGRVGSGCPTFNWTAVEGATAYELVVYDVAAEERGLRRTEDAVLRLEMPGGATGWTPDLAECLPPGRYSWAVAAILREAPGGRRLTFSQPAVFRVERLGRVDDGKLRGRPSATASTPLPAAPAFRLAPAPSAPRAVTGEAYVPAFCASGSETFADVPASHPFCHWIEQVARDGISSGCGAGNFCPDDVVTRGQLAAFLERAMRGTASWSPGQGSSLFPSPPGGSVTAVDDVGEHTSIAVGADGLPVISYHDAAAGSLMVAHCNDIACTGQDETVTAVDDSANDDGQFTSITIGADGFPIISHYDGESQVLKVVHCDDVACAGGGESITTVDPTPGVGASSSITIGMDGLPIVSYYDANEAALRVAHCNDVACSGQDETVNLAHNPATSAGWDPSITIGVDGLPIISLHAAGPGALRVVHCDDVLCDGGAEPYSDVDNPANIVGRYSAIAVGSDGLPIISYHDLDAGSLKVVHCNDIACIPPGETITVVDDPANIVANTRTSLTIGADGLPLITYSDANLGQLKIAHCNDVACAGQDETITVANDPDSVGGWSSVTIGADGLPIISYKSSVGLKVLHCANALCTAFWRRHGDPGAR